jgi:hypothetical protein
MGIKERLSGRFNEHVIDASNAWFFDQRVSDLSRLELLALIGWLLEYHDCNRYRRRKAAHDAGDEHAT